MEVLLLYSFKSAFALTLLYVPYIFLLSRDSFFSFNRRILLFIVLLSMVLPWLNISALSWDFSSMMQTAPVLGMIDAAIVESVSIPDTDPSPEPKISWMNVASWGYIIGVLAILVWQLLGLYRLRSNFQRSCLWKEQNGNVTIYCHAEEIAPCSWMNNIVISEKDYQENAHKIITHEMGHIQAGHSWDLLLLAVFQSIQWWNPVVYFFGNSLRDIHEYEADRHVLAQGISLKEYQLLLIKKVVDSNSYIFANNLCNSLTLKRIAMMQKKKSNTWMRSKVLYIIPVATLALSAFATSSSTSPVDTNVPKVRDKVNKKSGITLDTMFVVGYNTEAFGSRQKVASNNTSQAILLNNNKIEGEKPKALAPKNIQQANVIKNSKVTKGSNQRPNFEHASYPGGTFALIKKLAQVIKYPEIAQEKGIQGTVLLQLTIGKDGKVEKTEIQKSLSKECDQAAIEASKKLKQFAPAKENGQPVKSKYTLPIKFRIQK